ncbi:hypothetical protein ACFE04_026547 [Oxalis oulophora]
MGGGEGDGDGQVTVNIRCSNGSKFAVKVNLESTVDAFKAILADKCDVPANQQRLIYKGRILKDDQSLQTYGLEEDHTVHLVRSFSPPTNAPTTNTTQTATTPTTPIASNDTSNLGPSLFPGLGDLGGTAGAGLFGGLPDLEQAHQELSRNPNVMRQLMNMPAVQNLMNNPEMMRTMIMNNPQMREIIDRNPELGHILNDPNVLRQTMEAVRNPEIMREVMRTTDRAMSNIEASPEGFNMLRRMYENVQEPFLNATTMAGNTGSDNSANPFAALLGAQAGNQTGAGLTNNTSTTDSPSPNANPLPNPWAPTGTAGGGQTNNVRASPVGGPRPQQMPAGLGGLGGLPDFESMLGSTMPNANSLNQLMQNPAISEMMQSIISNPQYMNQILNTNPQLRTLLDSNPQLREMMLNPEFLRQLTNPETMQQMLTMQSLMSGVRRPQTTQQQGQTGGATGSPNNMGLDMLLNMFGGLGTGNLAVPSQSNVPPEQLYATQLSQLQEMGFFDTQENIRALTATAGNVNAAVERLLGNPGL